MYQDQHHHYEDTKSTGYSFTLVGVAGIILIILVDTGVISLSIADYMKIILTIVMGCVFGIFTIIGIHSFLSLGKIKENAKDQEDLEQQVMDTFLAAHKSELLAFCPEGFSAEDIYFPRSEEIRRLLAIDFPALSEEQQDHFIEEIYAQIYG